MIKYLLDTDICIYMMNKSPANVFKKLMSLKIGEVGVSSITCCELQYGVSNSHAKEQNQKLLNKFLSTYEILNFPNDAARLYGEIRVHLKNKGNPIGIMDLLIGTHALHLDTPLVTNNTSEFSRIPNLKTENWV